ncbi:hypothetical protein HCU64_24830 [Methylobacterium sp. C25]|uniref:hypothetical protein n=1 Tax=Methylobacterium sp. C25 TaxID=2721622 RepID=UPI001F345162|nr:hypothetical protein [Methylobacterium sp. C25]MCE4226967.1 hypothetical protein [Methylobacterium sp. C25]
MMQRRFLKASRNMGFSATVSARALNVAGTLFSGFVTWDTTAPATVFRKRRAAPEVEQL